MEIHIYSKSDCTCSYYATKLVKLKNQEKKWIEIYQIVPKTLYLKHLNFTI